MRAARPPRDDRGVHQTVGSVVLALTPRAGAAVATAPPADAPMANDAAHSEPGLAWQSSIGQVIFLQSLVATEAEAGARSSATHGAWLGGKLAGAQRR